VSLRPDGPDPRGRGRTAVIRDSRALLLSVVASSVFAVGSLVWGLLAGSQMIVFDGLYSFVSVALSLLAVWALRAARSGPDERYPWGREVFEPLTITVKAAALAGLCAYAMVGGIGEIFAGGREIEAGWAVLYGAVATAVGVGVSLVLRRMSRGATDLVRAEAAEWMGDALLSIGTLAGFGVALGLQLAGRGDLARYVDPAMVVLTSAIYLRIQLRLAAPWPARGLDDERRTRGAGAGLGARRRGGTGVAPRRACGTAVQGGHAAGRGHRVPRGRWLGRPLRRGVRPRPRAAGRPAAGNRAGAVAVGGLHRRPAMGRLNLGRRDAFVRGDRSARGVAT
jgi:hypothetical protein